MSILDHVIVDEGKTLRDLVREVRELRRIIDAGGGGGGGALATPTVSGTVKIDAVSADPVVYLKSSVDTLLTSYYTSAQVDTALAGKSNTGHTHNGSDIAAGTVGAAFLGSGTPDATKFLRGDSSWAAAGGGAGASEWANVIASTGDEDVTNSITLVDHSELTFAVTAGRWLVQLFIVWSTTGNNLTGARQSISFPSGTYGIHQYSGVNRGSGTITANANGVYVNNAAKTADIGPTLGVSDHNFRLIMWHRLFLTIASSGDVTFTFANQTAALANVTRIHTGSTMQYTQLD